MWNNSNAICIYDVTYVELLTDAKETTRFESIESSDAKETTLTVIDRDIILRCNTKSTRRNNLIGKNSVLSEFATFWTSFATFLPLFATFCHVFHYENSKFWPKSTFFEPIFFEFLKFFREFYFDRFLPLLTFFEHLKNEHVPKLSSR